MSPTKKRRAWRRMTAAYWRLFGKSTFAIAKRLGCSETTVYALLKEAKSAGPVCLNCGGPPDGFVCPKHKHATVADLGYALCEKAVRT